MLIKIGNTSRLQNYLQQGVHYVRLAGIQERIENGVVHSIEVAFDNDHSYCGFDLNYTKSIPLIYSLYDIFEIPFDNEFNLGKLFRSNFSIFMYKYFSIEVEEVASNLVLNSIIPTINRLPPGSHLVEIRNTNYDDNYYYIYFNNKEGRAYIRMPFNLNFKKFVVIILASLDIDFEENVDYKVQLEQLFFSKKLLYITVEPIDLITNENAHLTISRFERSDDFKEIDNTTNEDLPF